MMSSLPTRLMVVQIAIIAEAQHFGIFVHTTAYYSITYEVKKNYEVTFGVNVTVEPTEWFPDAKSSSFRLGPYPLKRLSSNAFTVDFEGHKHSLRDWYMLTQLSMVAGGITEVDDEYPPMGIKFGDLSIIHYEDLDTISATFRGEEIIFKRVTRSWKPGRFVYRECMDPRFWLSYDIDTDGFVSMRAKCEGRRTRRVRFHLVPRTGDSYEYYDVLPSGDGTTLAEFQQSVRSVCRTKYVTPIDFSYVTFAGDDVLFVMLGGEHVALTEV
ncbi:hypothetical protein FOZ63_028092 [Perkinsus olseni]|uniref:Uncharacterized protein n=2 Tax=Perkinsus olseni TaxID=32597 RepID=A0A7J6T910_PEROL|nr:hypothetical protein FOZ63_028092 [Perkinsus olseni]